MSSFYHLCVEYFSQFSFWTISLKSNCWEECISEQSVQPSNSFVVNTQFAQYLLYQDLWNKTKILGKRHCTNEFFFTKLKEMEIFLFRVTSSETIKWFFSQNFIEFCLFDKFFECSILSKLFQLWKLSNLLILIFLLSRLPTDNPLYLPTIHSTTDNPLNILKNHPLRLVKYCCLLFK